MKEVLMGHYVGLEGSYLRPAEDELLKEYVKAIDLLTISEEKYLRHQVEKLKTEVSDIDTEKNALGHKMELEKERQERAKLYELLYKQGLIKKGVERYFLILRFALESDSSAILIYQSHFLISLDAVIYKPRKIISSMVDS